MAVKVKSYFLAPNWDYQKDGPLALGDVISDPGDPVFSKLSGFTTAPELALPKIYHNPPERWSHTASQSRSHEFNVFAHFLAGLGVGLGAGISRSNERHQARSYTMDSIQTSYFVPEPSYILSRLRDPNVSLFLGSRKLFESKKLYIVTGVKVARGLVVETVFGKNHMAGVDTEASLTPIGVPVSIGLGGKIGWGREDQTIAGKDHTDVEVVFAFQLRQIKVKGRQGQETAESKLLNKGAFLDTRDQSADVRHDASEFGDLDDFEIGDHELRLVDVESTDSGGGANVLQEKDIIADGEQCKLVVNVH